MLNKGIEFFDVQKKLFKSYNSKMNKKGAISKYLRFMFSDKFLLINVFYSDIYENIQSVPKRFMDKYSC